MVVVLHRALGPGLRALGRHFGVGRDEVEPRRGVGVEGDLERAVSARCPRRDVLDLEDLADVRERHRVAVPENAGDAHVLGHAHVEAQPLDGSSADAH